MKFDANPTITKHSKIDSGERDAVLPKSGVQVAHFWPVLKGPTLSPRAGRKPDACPAESQGAHLPPVIQPKSGRDPVQNPAIIVDSPELDRERPDRLITFFQLLDRWERKSHAETVT